MRRAVPVDYAAPTGADRVRELIRRAGLTQCGAARELGVDERTVRYWCSGQIKPPRMAFLALERLVERVRTVDGELC